jgi:Holliday junction resolvasome RuvABC endonuclease subunit
MYTYGIDISTTCIGFGIVDEKKNLIHYDKLKFKQTEKLQLEEKASMFREKLSELSELYWPSMIKVEEPLKSFGRKTTAHTMSILQAFNAMCRYVVFDEYGDIPQQVAARSARKSMGILQRKKRPKNEIKKLVIDAVQKRFPSFTYTLTPMGNPKPGTDDMADAIVIALY